MTITDCHKDEELLDIYTQYFTYNSLKIINFHKISFGHSSKCKQISNITHSIVIYDIFDIDDRRTHFDHEFYGK